MVNPVPESESRWLPKFNVDFLVGTCLPRDTAVIKFSGRYDQFFQRYDPIVENVRSQCSKNPLKIPRSVSRNGWLPKCNNFFLVHRFIFGKIFMKIWSIVFLREVANMQTNRQTNAGYNVTSLMEVLKKEKRICNTITADTEHFLHTDKWDYVRNLVHLSLLRLQNRQEVWFICINKSVWNKSPCWSRFWTG